MSIREQQIKEIRKYLLESGLDIPAVVDDMQDHFCCVIEDSLRAGNSFETAFAEARLLVPPEDIREIQSDTIYYLTIKSKIMHVKGIFLTAFFSVFLYVLGTIIYKFMILSGAGPAGEIRFILQTLGLVVFGFGFLPLLFSFGYKQFVARLQA
ncbi:hypothetical protein [Flavilitoribacter nigricans]|uniref:Uncharacterized protein n=1 Tax=Flavilitoribacter nigricans (strain ATCC 23147 / DSM 23189 / NBRC 102662 / NCIMB 1420 / SS-2) TaxID=1122177 RepID=A0A2D0N6I5_FLAN2|nr:hypothetical protein [Flavilitoribacter nigricans]PHN04000.1 hypothetical protein CRP01_24330 [Flavilitoribacter nigricans DSM 23189 = NBRC 102662]